MNSPAINNLPLWVKVIGYLGFPIAVASLLLWVLVKQLDVHNNEFKYHDVKADNVAKEIDRHAHEMHEAIHRLSYILQTMCQNTAKTKEDAARCLEKP